MYFFAPLQLRALAPKANKFEKVKNAKCGSTMWTEIQDLATLIREGKTTWEDLELDDVDIRLKWAGLFHRRKRTPGRFMMRLKVSFNLALLRYKLFELDTYSIFFVFLFCPGPCWRAHF